MRWLSLVWPLHATQQTDDDFKSSSEVKVKPSPLDPAVAGIKSGCVRHMGHSWLRMSELRNQTIRLDLQPLVIGSA